MIPVIGGSVDIKDAPSGLYIFKIEDSNNISQTFKISIR